ncbi:cyclopropane-fatty-acyl-phospholipid synthase family protein [Roseibium sp. RKSG952]|uniref:SAM-dependent methyltransferase n=1 Tax=Roseibium sp. RKSG952 TaxID=2529384 RepID=UPI0012BB668B|nr:class I SAM-dependent methyltransferase [Roseibium sp. RKSG952]MTH96177.1 class I SAM-dependent methyltransferase [Roseibium sp. RKSG952]
MQGSTQTASLMDRVYRRQRHVYDITRKYYLLGRDHLLEQLQPVDGAHVLELGCGTGRNLIQAARRYPGVRFYGVDISAQMLETARQNVARAGLADRILLKQGDASDAAVTDGLGPETFDRVFYSYTLSMMPIWREALQAGLGCLSDDGRLCIVDFGQLERLPKVFKAGLYRWLESFHVTPRPDLTAFVSELAEHHGRAVRSKNLYRGYALYLEASGRASAHSPATK